VQQPGQHRCNGYDEGAKEKKAKTTTGIPQMAVKNHSKINPMAWKDKGCKTMISS
jgi:hypothetical protein